MLAQLQKSKEKSAIFQTFQSQTASIATCYTGFNLFYLKNGMNIFHSLWKILSSGWKKRDILFGVKFKTFFDEIYMKFSDGYERWKAVSFLLKNLW